MTVPFLQNVKPNTHTHALDVFKTLGVPTKNVENWHYLDLQKSLGACTYTLAPETDTPPPSPYHIGDIPRIVITNGHIGDIPPLPQGVHLERGIDTSTDTHTQDIHAMVALNTAHYHDGITLTITQDMDTPLHLAYVHAGGRLPGGLVVFPRVHVVVKSGVRADIIESYQHTQGEVLVNAVSEFFVEDSATLAHYKIQDSAQGSKHVAFHRAHVAENGMYNHTFICVNTPLTRNEVFVDLNGTHANADIKGIYITDTSQTVDNTVFVRHLAEDCDSSQLFKGILNDTSQGIFQGKIYVDCDAQRTDGYQMHRAILLSRDAEIDCKPELEIYADDVKCSHGASTGEIDAEQLFYLRARGIPETLARQMLLKGFLVEVLDDIENEAIHTFLTDITLYRVSEVLS